MTTVLYDEHRNPMTGSDEAVALYDHALDRLLRFHPDVVGAADSLAGDHGHVPMGQALIAYLSLMSTDSGDLAAASDAAALLRTSAEHRRERFHAAAVDAWLAGDWARASATLDEVLVLWPTDLLALVIGHQLDFFLGDAANLRDRVGRSLPEVDRASPHLGFVHGMHAFGLEEAGHYQAAEEAGLAALDANRDDVWAVHAVVHTFEMQGRVDDGLRFMLDREGDWGSGNLFTTHNWWHLALYCIEAGDPARALQIYDSQLHNDGSAGVPIEMLDASALLWRFLLDGVDTGGRFGPLADAWAAKTDMAPWYSFNDMHAVMANVGAGRLAEARDLITRMRTEAEGALGTNGRMANDIGIPACEAVVAFGERRYDDVIAHLAPIRRRFHHFGGSHAQRDALQRTLLEAALRAEQHELARSLTAERLSVRDNATYNWLQRARALRAIGDPAGAASATHQADIHRRTFAAAISRA
jgi:tetratricopeptide (TPR) repeat protein